MTTGEDTQPREGWRYLAAPALLFLLAERGVGQCAP
jgi:hypothetical protein